MIFNILKSRGGKKKNENQYVVVLILWWATANKSMIGKHCIFLSLGTTLTFTVCIQVNK